MDEWMMDLRIGHRPSPIGDGIDEVQVHHGAWNVENGRWNVE